MVIYTILGLWLLSTPTAGCPPRRASSPWVPSSPARSARPEGASMAPSGRPPRQGHSGSASSSGSTPSAAASAATTISWSCRSGSPETVTAPTQPTPRSLQREPAPRQHAVGHRLRPELRRQEPPGLLPLPPQPVGALVEPPDRVHLPPHPVLVVHRRPRHGEPEEPPVPEAHVHHRRLAQRRHPPADVEPDRQRQVGIEPLEDEPLLLGGDGGDQLGGHGTLLLAATAPIPTPHPPEAHRLFAPAATCSAAKAKASRGARQP